MIFQIFGPISNSFLPPSYRDGIGLAFFIKNIVNSIFLIAGLGTFAFLIIGGIRYLTAGGDTKATEEAVKIITNAVIGLTIVMAAYGAARIVAAVFGINIFSPVFVRPT